MAIDETTALMLFRNVVRRLDEATRTRNAWVASGADRPPSFFSTLEAHDEVILDPSRDVLEHFQLMASVLDRVERHAEEGLRFERYFDEAASP